MFIMPDNAKIIFYSKPISQLKGVDGLMSVIQNDMKLEPQANQYYLFCNTKRDRFKILYKEGDNLAIWFKRFKGTLGFSYTHQIVIFDKQDFLTFIEKTSSKHHYTLKNIFI
jgi:hypothetical protein